MNASGCESTRSEQQLREEVCGATYEFSTQVPSADGAAEFAEVPSARDDVARGLALLRDHLRDELGLRREAENENAGECGESGENG